MWRPFAPTAWQLTRASGSGIVDAECFEPADSGRSHPRRVLLPHLVTAGAATPPHPVLAPRARVHRCQHPYTISALNPLPQHRLRTLRRTLPSPSGAGGAACFPRNWTLLSAFSRTRSGYRSRTRYEMDKTTTPVLLPHPISALTVCDRRDETRNSRVSIFSRTRPPYQSAWASQASGPRSLRLA
ncbi:hypothetical protein B0H13DRAFT_2316568 [Mycena leptocephala]|nr:hypothetical protein B0H13DRAFT_2316568 [Mycena leptocephala]